MVRVLQQTQAGQKELYFHSLLQLGVTECELRGHKWTLKHTILTTGLQNITVLQLSFPICTSFNGGPQLRAGVSSCVPSLAPGV